MSVSLSMCHTIEPIKIVHPKIMKYSLWAAQRTLAFVTKLFRILIVPRGICVERSRFQ